MKSQLQFWWKKIKEYPISSIVISVAIIVVIALIVVVILGYCLNWDWTGLGPYTPPNSNYQRGKTLWDWLQLLIIPAVLAIAGYAFTLTTSQNERRATEQRSKDEQKAAEQRSQTERGIALDNQRESALQDYIDKMSELLLEKKLRESQPDDEVRKIARVRTLTVLPRLDAERKKSVLQFLNESGLINAKECIIDLNGADLSGTNLSDTDLWGVDLSGVDLSRANLSRTRLWGARLTKANLSGANLSGAFPNNSNVILFSTILSIDIDLREANLKGANLSYNDFRRINFRHANLSNAIVSLDQLKEAMILQGATMPDGTIHP